MKRGFTLIELLVVISIIGLLSGVVLVSLNSAKDKAKIAKNQSFARSVHEYLVVDSTGNWEFENTLEDSSENNLDFEGMNYSFTDGISGKAVLLQSSGQIWTPLTNKSGAITIQTWLKREGAGEDFIIIKHGSFYIWNVSSDLIVKIYESTGFCNVAINDNSLMNGKWHHLLVSYNGKDTLRVYIDGEEVASTGTCSGPVDNSPYDFKIQDNFAGIIVDEFMIYDGTFLEE